MRKQNSEFLTAFTSEANTHLKNTDSFAYVELDDYAFVYGIPVHEPAFVKTVPANRQPPPHKNKKPQKAESVGHRGGT